jgi:hypothetical protein
MKPIAFRLLGMVACLLAVAAPAAAQRSVSDRDLLNRPNGSGLSTEDRKRFDELKGGEQEQQQLTAARMRRARALLKTPPLPPERNGLLGSWRLRDNQRPMTGAVDVLTSSRSSLAESLAALSSFDKFGCQVDWAGGITFAPTTYSQRKAGGRVVEGAPIAYRSARRGAKQVTVAITDYDFAMAFEIASPDSIVDGDGCVLVRVGAAAANSSVSPAAGAMPRSSTALQAAGPAGVVVDGAAFRCGDGRLLHVSLCQGNANDAPCKITKLHLPGLQIGEMVRRADIAAQVKGCEAGGIRFTADNKPVFVR